MYNIWFWQCTDVGCLSNDATVHWGTSPEIQHRIALTNLPHNGRSKNSIFRVNALTFWIITPKVFIVLHLIQHSHVPKQIRNWTIPRLV